MSSKINSYLRLVRPESWIKNLLVFGALIFSGEFFNYQNTFRTIIVFSSFCTLSSFFYVWNDWLDRRADSNHPLKQSRPLARGTIKGTEALVLGVILVILTFFFLFQLPQVPRRHVMIVFSIYALIQVLYNLFLKHLFVLDLMAVAVGYVLRAISGGVVIQVPLTYWFLLTIFILSLLLISGKRRSDLDTLPDDEAVRQRSVFRNYSVTFLNRIIVASATISFITYSLYTMAPSGGQRISPYGMPFSILFVAFGLARYLFLIFKKNEGNSPERLFLYDRPLQTAVVGWILYVIVLFLV